MPSTGSRWRPPRPFLAIPLLLVFALAACGGAGDDPQANGPNGTPPQLAYPRGADELVLQIEYTGGFLTPEATFAEVPFYSLYGDGRLIFAGPMIEIYPPPALPNLRVRQLTDEGMARLLERAAEAGLLEEGRDLGYPPVADAPTARFTLQLEEGTYVTEVYALGFEGDQDPRGEVPPADGSEAPSDSTLTEEQLEARQRLLDFQAALFDLDAWLGDEIGPDEEYLFEALAVRIAPPPPEPDPEELEPALFSWPLADLGTLGRSEDGHRVAVIAGGELEQLRPQLLSANTLTLWESEGETYHLAFRPLLPHETEAP
jgi:hypothetical protein